MPLKRADPSPAIVLSAVGMVALVWGAGPVVTKLVTAPPLVGAALRFGLSFPVLFTLAAITGHRVTRASLMAAALPGMAFGINMVFVFATVQEAAVAVLSVVVALQPALLLIVAGPIFGERPTQKHVLWTLVGVAATAGVILGAGKELRASWLGLAFSMLAMLTFSVYFVLTRLARTRHNVDPIQWMAGANFWAFVVLIPLVLVFVDRSDIQQFGGYDWLWIALVAYVTGAAGHVLMGWVHGYVEAARSSLYLQSMHIVALGGAWLVHDEPITWIQGVAGLVVLGAVAAVIRIPTATPVPVAPLPLATADSAGRSPR
ncbi:MAG: DMT family transporter [Acidimicrobiales bacterium]